MKNNTKRKKNRMAVSNTAYQKKYKQYKKESKQNKSKRNILFKMFVTIFVAILAIILIIFSGAFNITEIQVENNSLVSSEQIISFSGIEKGTNLFAFSKNEIANKVKENPYVENVEIKRILPNKVKLIVDERKIEYALQLANSYVYIDKQGYIIEISNNSPTVPIIIGFKTDLSNIKPTERLDNEDLKKMNIVIKILDVAKNNSLDNLITKIDISNVENYTVYFDTEGKIAYLGDGNQLNTRFLYIKAILKEQNGKSGEIFANVDLNNEYVYFRENI